MRAPSISNSMHFFSTSEESQLKTWSQATAQAAGSSENSHSLKARGERVQTFRQISQLLAGRPWEGHAAPGGSTWGPRGPIRLTLGILLGSIRVQNGVRISVPPKKKSDGVILSLWVSLGSLFGKILNAFFVWRRNLVMLGQSGIFIEFGVAFATSLIETP